MKDLEEKLEILILQSQDFLDYMLINYENSNNTKEQCLELALSLENIKKAKNNLSQFGKLTGSS